MMGNLVAKIENEHFKMGCSTGEGACGCNVDRVSFTANFYFSANIYKDNSGTYNLQLTTKPNKNKGSYAYFGASGSSIGQPTYSIYIDDGCIYNANMTNFNMPPTLNTYFTAGNNPKTITLEIKLGIGKNFKTYQNEYVILHRRFPLCSCNTPTTIASLKTGTKLNLGGYKMRLCGSFGYTNVSNTNTRLVMFENSDTQLTIWDEKRDNFYGTSPVADRCNEVYKNLPYDLKNNILLSEVPYVTGSLVDSYSSDKRIAYKSVATLSAYLFPVSPKEYYDGYIGSGGYTGGSTGGGAPYSLDYQYVDENVIDDIVTQWTWSRNVVNYGSTWCLKSSNDWGQKQTGKFPDGLPIYFLASLNADLKVGEQDSQGCYTVITNNNPNISDYDHYLGEKNSAFSIDYTVWDDDDDKLSVTQKLNTSVLGTYSNVGSGTSSTIYITDDMLKKIPLNQKQYIYIYVDDGKGGQSTRTLSFTRTNSTPTINGYNMDLGDKNVGFSIDYTVSDADNDTITVTELLNGHVIRQIPNVKGSASETLIISKEQLYKTPLHQQSTIVITVADDKGGISKRTYTFTRTNTPVAIGIIKKTYPTITFRCTDSNPNGYVRLVEIFINNNRVQSFTSGFDRELEYNIDFSYLNEGNNTLMIRATNNQNIVSNKNLNVHKKSLKEPEVGTNIIVKGKKYQIINKKLDRDNIKLVLNKPLQDDISTTDRVEILNDYCKVFAKTDENGEYEEMQFIKSKDLGNGHAEERYQLDITGRKVTTRVLMYGNTAIKQVKEAFQYLED